VNDFNWIGSPQQELGLLIVSTKAPATTIEELKLRSIAVSGTGLGTAPSVFPRVLNEVIGTKFRVVEGYPGSQEALLALEKGEVDGHVSGGSSAAFRGRINPWIAKGEAKVLLQLGMKKDDAYSSAPLAFELVQSESDRQFLELAFTAEVLGRPLVAPPGIPPGRFRLLRAAFDAVMKDPQLLAEAGKMQLDINPVTGAEIAAVLKKAYALPASQIERARSVATKR
jgi:tripartite-type tricarboxylate transporter receptor subunit TctC